LFLLVNKTPFVFGYYCFDLVIEKFIHFEIGY